MVQLGRAVAYKPKGWWFNSRLGLKMPWWLHMSRYSVANSRNYEDDMILILY